MNLRQVGVILGAVADVTNELRNAFMSFERKRRAAPHPGRAALLLVAGAAIGAAISRPEVRRRVRELFMADRRRVSVAPSETETAQPTAQPEGRPAQPEGAKAQAPAGDASRVM